MWKWKKVWWICSKGHSYISSIAHRVGGSGCPYCSGNKVLKGYNDLATVRPDLAEEWSYDKNINLTPEMIVVSSNNKVWWRCKQGHEWIAAISNRSRGTGCPYCSGNKVLKGYNDLATVRPDVAKEWNYQRNNKLLPTMVTCKSVKKVWWMCEKGHEWESVIQKRSEGYGCPYCSGRKVLKGYNDLATLKPDLAKEWSYVKNDFLTPDLFTLGSNRIVWWKCEQGHEWRANIANRVLGRGCPYCNSKLIKVGYNDLATLRPDLEKEWNYKKNVDLKPDMVMLNSNRKVWWKCSKGHEWLANIDGRSRGNGCPYCAKKSYKNREIYNFKTNIVINEYYQCECQKCGYSNILTIDEMKEHYQLCNSI